MKYLIFDISNVLYRTYFSSATIDIDSASGMALHMGFTTLNKYFKMVNPDKVVMTFDRSSWRKQYTASDECISRLPYKGTRRKDMTPAQREKFANFLVHLKEFEEMIRNHTTIIPLGADLLEADDCMAGWVYTHPNDEHILITTDTDMAQLLYMDNVRIISPATNKDMSLEKFDADAKYFLFQKCIRGDTADNVGSAFPRVRETRIKRSYKDPYEFTQMMAETWINHDGREMNVGELYKENQLLMDLTKQPSNIKELIAITIDEAEENSYISKFSLFHIMKFCGKHDLKMIVKGIDNYVPMMSR